MASTLTSGMDHVGHDVLARLHRPDILVSNSDMRALMAQGGHMSDDPVSVVARRIGPVEVSQFGAKSVAVRCPRDFDGLMRQTGGLWEAGSHAGRSSADGSIR